MNRSTDWDHLLPEHRALQHERAPRPLPLFLELIRDRTAEEPELAREALRGLIAYERSERAPMRAAPSIAATAGPASLRDCGGEGPPAVLVPSLINPPHVLDLDDKVSLTRAIAQLGRRALLVDWGPAEERSTLDVGGHVEELLLPLLAELEQPAALIGYCLGGTMALAAAQAAPVERVATLAAPWHFSAYPEASREALADLWGAARPSAEALGALPMEVLQSAFWALDPRRVVAKFADFAKLDPASPEARRFIALEDWANQGEPLPLPAARQLIEDFFGADRPGRGEWEVCGRRMTDGPPCPALHLAAARDRIVPATTAAHGEVVAVDAGHVGMVVGSARSATLAALARFLGRG